MPKLIRLGQTAPGVGARIRELRQSRGWSLQQLATASGVPLSSLAKAETDRHSLPIDRLFRVADALGETVTRFFDDEGAMDQAGAVGRRSVTRAGKGEATTSPHYACEWLFADLSQKAMTPIIQVIRPRTIEEFGPLQRHEGEEFCLVLSGRVALVTDVYEPLIMDPMDGAYIDSRMGHAYLNVGEGEASILNVSTDAGLRRS